MADDGFKVRFEPKGKPLKGRTPTPRDAATGRTPTPKQVLAKLKLQQKPAKLDLEPPPKARTPTPRGTTPPPKKHDRIASVAAATPGKPAPPPPAKSRTPTPRGTHAPSSRTPTSSKPAARPTLPPPTVATPRHVDVSRMRGDVVPPPTTTPADMTPAAEMFPVYARALELTTLVFALQGLAEVERDYLRDQLDRNTTTVPRLVARALATVEMAGRRELYWEARLAVADVASILDVLAIRGTVEAEALEPARALARVLAAELHQLAVPPPNVY